jgi:phage/plasmid-associated DNA primase
VVPFPNTFLGKENRDLDAELQTDAELSGILARAVTTLPTVMERGRLLEPNSVQDAKKQFISSSDGVRHFVDSECELDPGAWTLKTNLYHAYSHHANESGSKVMSNREFYNRIEQINGVQDHRKTAGRGYQGIRLIGQP